MALVTVPKDDMNKLVMNFLVTEASANIMLSVLVLI